MSKINKKRKAAYYIGMGMIIVGFILFVSVFFKAGNIMTNSFNSFASDPFFSGPSSSFIARPVIGMILIISGAIVMSIGEKGAAGSGLILDPDKAREDLKPFNEAKGAMINDVISNIHVVDSLANNLNNKNQHKEIIKIKCRNCNKLNDEDAKYCKECGRHI
ncbi:MAG: zinc ribbon domain-containing protein [Clostridiales bacterium]|nr:zinc ribbon domain-containing protein [Clostridiales bacterium]